MPYVGGISDASSTPRRPGGAGADVDEPPAVSQGMLNQFEGAGDRLANLVDGGRDLLIFGIDELDDLQWAQTIDFGRERVSLLCQAGIGRLLARHATVPRKSRMDESGSSSSSL